LSIFLESRTEDILFRDHHQPFYCVEGDKYVKRNLTGFKNHVLLLKIERRDQHERKQIIDIHIGFSVYLYNGPSLFNNHACSKTFISGPQIRSQ
jgi:hypothetical protein